MWNHTWKQHGVLIHRFAYVVRLSSEGALIYLQIVGLNQDTISRQQVPWTQMCTDQCLSHLVWVSFIVQVMSCIYLSYLLGLHQIALTKTYYRDKQYIFKRKRQCRKLLRNMKFTKGSIKNNKHTTKCIPKFPIIHMVTNSFLFG